ncbi:MAG: hypothetical protein HY064_13090 [Bacteroidetes bacterium]|nr:hypothetical protein [Bacteroidota bacterium]
MKQPYTRLLLFIFLTSPLALLSQGFGLPTGFDLKTFEKNQDLAIWFLQYDSAVANVASFDHLSGKDFIAYPDKKGWKVVAGTVDSSGFKSDAGYYLIDPKKTITSSKKKFDTLQVCAMGRALYYSKKAIAKLAFKAPSGWDFLTKLNDDKSITVWAFLLPDPNGSLWYGPECAWYYMQDGIKLSTSRIVNRTPLMADKNGTTLSLSCPTDKMPSIGAIYIARKYMTAFPEVDISYKTGTSTLRYNTTEKNFSWEHVGN